MVIVCTYKTCGVRVIVSNNYQNDHAQLVNAVLGMPHYERDLTKRGGDSDKERRRVDDLVDKMNECDMEEAPPNADDLFAYEFFKKADLLRNARVYAGNDQLQDIDLTNNADFLEFWNTNGQFLTWRLLKEQNAEVSEHEFNNFNTLPQTRQNELNIMWDTVSAHVFQLAQLYFNDVSTASKME